MTNNPIGNISDEKLDASHLEVHGAQASEGTSGVLAQSRYADLPLVAATLTFKKVFIMGLAASTGAMYIGYTGSAIGNIVANEGFINQFGTVQTPNGLALNAQYVSIWGAVQQVAQIAFQFGSPFVIDRFGRKAAMYGLTLFVIIAIILEIVARDWKVFLAAKLFSGAASGWLGPGVMTYLSEIAMPQFRGILLCAFTLSLALGQFSNSVACQIVNSSYPMLYLRVFYSQFVFVGIWVAVIIWIPESPTWCILQGHDVRGKAAMKRLAGSVPGYDLDYEFACLREQIHVSEEITRSYSDNDWKALIQWGNFKRCIAASLPFAGQQLCGVPYIFFYNTYFFQSAGLSDPFQASVIINCIYLASIIASFFLVDKIGRRPLVIYGLAVLGVLNILIGALGFIPGESSPKGSALTAMCSLWMCAFGLTLSPLGWVGVVEVSSARLRAKTAAFAVIINSLLGLIFTYTVPLMLSDQYAGWANKIGLLFGGLSLVFVPVLWYLYPETRNRSYNQIDELYERGVPARHFHKIKLEDQQAPTAVA